MWIKASDKYPECDWWLAREIATGKRLPMLFATHVIAGVGGKTYKPYEVEYFDESPSSDPAEVQQLRQWKKEATALLDPILEYGLKHPDIKLGQSATSFVLNRAKAAEVLVKALKMIRDESGTYRNYQAGSIAAYALAEYEQLKQQ